MTKKTLRASACTVTLISANENNGFYHCVLAINGDASSKDLSDVSVFFSNTLMEMGDLVLDLVGQSWNMSWRGAFADVMRRGAA